MKSSIRVNFSDFWHANTLEAKQNNFLFRLLAKRFDLEICDQPDFLFFSCFGVDFIRHKGVRIFYTGENVRPNFSLCDWAFSFDYNDHPRHLRLPYYAYLDLDALCRPRDVDALMLDKTRFCSFIYSNAKASVRLKFLDKLSRYKPVDCGGSVRNNLGYRVADKIPFLQPYKFNIAFENESFPGYTTEKIGEAFLGNTVPIYWGNPLVSRDFNTNAFVNSHDFRNLDQIVEFVVELDRNDALYRQYLGAPAFANNERNQFVNENRILDRFEEIFSKPIARPIAQTMRGQFASLIREPKRRRRVRRAARANKTS